MELQNLVEFSESQTRQLADFFKTFIGNVTKPLPFVKPPLFLSIPGHILNNLLVHYRAITETEKKKERKKKN